jgi:hypothetical protein
MSVEQLEKKPTLVGVYVEEQLENPQVNQVVSYHNKEGKSRIGKVTEVSDETVKIEGRFDIPKGDIYSVKVESEGERLPLHPRWFEHLLKNKFEYKPGKQVKFFLDEEGQGIFVNKQGYKDVNYYGKYFEDFLTEIRNTGSNAEAKSLFFKHNYKVVRVPSKKESAE